MEKKRIIVVTGLSGSGKTTAANALEDAGFYCVDNLPVSLLPKFLELYAHSEGSQIKGLGFIMDLREKGFLEHQEEVFKTIQNQGWGFQLIFLEAREEILITRFSQTRRHHPLALGASLLSGIRSEREKMADIREKADYLIDTSETSVHELKAQIMDLVRKSISADSLRVDLLSFGFKYGLPRGLDLLIDVRFLPNPYFVHELREFSGEDARVRDFILGHTETGVFLQKYCDLLDYLLPLYKKEGKAYLTIGIGCTGGRHRSVAIASYLFGHLEGKAGQLGIHHRDLLRDTSPIESSPENRS